MNASISDAETPFSHLLRSRIHIKLVIAYDPCKARFSFRWAMLYEWDLVKCQYLCTYIRIVALFHHCIYLGTKGGAAVISYMKLYEGIRQHERSQAHAQMLNPPQTSVTKCTTASWCGLDTRSPVKSSLCSTVQSHQLAAWLQLQLLGMSSVRGWTRPWPFGIPRRSAERGKASLKDTFPPLLCSNSIVLTSKRCPTVCYPSNLCVIEFPINHPSIMHLVLWGNNHAAAQMMDTEFCSDWTERSISTWGSFTGLSGLSATKHKVIQSWIIMLDCTVWWSWCRVVFGADNIAVPHEHGDVQRWAHVCRSQTIQQHSWMKEKSQGNRGIGGIKKHCRFS